MRNDPPKGVATPKMRRGFKGFWVDVYRELKKVDWPKTKEVNRLTVVVLVVCLLVVVVLSAMSAVFGTIVNLLQGK
ncbi:MAG TPA: preprotein translocase subunit SecE [Fimbriimonadaceae bacterium]